MVFKNSNIRIAGITQTELKKQDHTYVYYINITTV